MFPKLLSLVLIAVVSVCPTLCRSGCCLGDCCAETQNGTDRSSDPVSRPTTHGCQCCQEQEPAPTPPSPAPCEHGKSCQCVCGGALLEEPCRLNQSIFSYSLSECRRSVNDSLFGVETDRALPAPCGSAMNQGRLVRILHSSFLC